MKQKHQLKNILSAHSFPMSWEGDYPNTILMQETLTPAGRTPRISRKLWHLTTVDGFSKDNLGRVMRLEARWYRTEK